MNLLPRREAKVKPHFPLRFSLNETDFKVLLGEHDHTKTGESRVLVMAVKKYVPRARITIRRHPSLRTFIHGVLFPPFFLHVVCRIHVHPDFDLWFLSSDFALLELEGPVDFGAHRHVRPICYPTQRPRSGDAVRTSYQYIIMKRALSEARGESGMCGVAGIEWHHPCFWEMYGNNYLSIMRGIPCQKFWG